jgi:hypothetical protein
MLARYMGLCSRAQTLCRGALTLAFEALRADLRTFCSEIFSEGSISVLNQFGVRYPGVVGVHPATLLEHLGKLLESAQLVESISPPTRVV